MTLFNETGHFKHHRLLSVSDLYSLIASGTWQFLWQPKMFPVFPNAFPENEPQIYFIIALYLVQTEAPPGMLKCI